MVVVNPTGSSPLLLVGDHAGRAIPTSLGRLGLSEDDLGRHIAWDIGVGGLGVHLAPILDAVLIRQAYSRLVVDCNRRPGSEGFIAEVSDGTPVPGNAGLTAEAIAQRTAEIYTPYQDAISGILDLRTGRRTVLVSLHSFTPSLQGLDRPWRFGVLHRGDSAYSRAVLAGLKAAAGEAVGDNAPYAMDEIDNTIPLHADPRGLDYLELEVRQDLIADEAGQEAVARFLSPILVQALETPPDAVAA